MNRLSNQERAKIIGCLVEGNSMRSTSRMMDVSINTVTKLLVDAGTACAVYHDANIRNLASKRVECDEAWCFCAMKEKNVPAEMKGVLGLGDVYTWVAIDSNSKLAISWLVGRRDAQYAHAFMYDVAARLSNRVQLSTDGHHCYLEAVEAAFGCEIDYGMLIKVFGAPLGKESDRRYSPAECTGTSKRRVSGNPDQKNISTAFVERQNLSMRMGMRRFTRLTNGFSKKIENLEHAVALHYMHYNFARIHKTLRITPAMAAGVSDHVWSLEEIAAL
ncbi:MAG: IS1 family transposase [Candidatus Hydrogenedentes bacterium]|nr:IS1 family transposase [Candidatus Hydrogenedentota bacterium]